MTASESNGVETPEAAEWVTARKRDAPLESGASTNTSLIDLFTAAGRQYGGEAQAKEGPRGGFRYNWHI
jgi:hypothetical protein